MGYSREGVPDWPLRDDGRPVQLGDVVKLPFGGTVLCVRAVSFMGVPGGAYVNGFWVSRGERMPLVRARKLRGEEEEGR